MRKPRIGKNIAIRVSVYSGIVKQKFFDEKHTWAAHIQCIRTKIAKGLDKCKAKKPSECPNTVYIV